MAGPRYGVRGSRELAAAFRQLGQAPTAAVRRRARAEALEPIKQAYVENLRANGSDETGALIASIGTGEERGRRNRTLLGAREGTFKGRVPSAYSHFPEYGTAPHYQPNRFGGIWHPGARPKPSLRPALESTVSAVAVRYFEVMASEIEGAARRIASRGGYR